MAIPVQDASNVFTDALVENVSDRTRPTAFLQGFFTSAFRPSKFAKIKVKRANKFVSVDVQRYADGTLYISSFSDEKKFLPPLHNGAMFLNDHELYDNIVGMIGAMSQGGLEGNQMALLQTQLQTAIAEMSQEIMDVQDTQLRAVELQCSEALRSGVITINADTNIDYKRKAASMVDLGAGNYWEDNVDPFETLEAGCQFLRKVGNSGSSRFNGIFGSIALAKLKNNTVYKEQVDLRNQSGTTITAPERPQEGAEYHGQLSCGSYIVDVWGYDQYYTNAAGVSTPYLDQTEVILIPTDAQFDLTFHQVPQVIRENATIPQTSEFLIQKFVNEEKGYEKMSVKCAPLAILTLVDRVFTVKVSA
jgi:hypothetical protein